MVSLMATPSSSGLSQLIFLEDNPTAGLGVLNINGDYIIRPEHEEMTLRYIINTFKVAIDESKQHDQGNIIINVFLDHYRSNNIRQPFILLVTKMLIKLFPDVLEQCNLINSPPMFKHIIKLIRLLLSQENNQRIKLVILPISDK